MLYPLAMKLNRLHRVYVLELLASVGACYAGPMVRGSPNPRHWGLPSRLRKARKQSGLTRKALGQKVGRDSEVAANIEAGQRIPTVGTVARLASGLGVSAAWLGFGLGEQNADGPAATTEGMGARLSAARIEQELTKAALARLAAISPPALANIENGGQTGIDVIDSLAKALNVSPAWLAYGVGPQVLPSRRGARAAQTSADT